VLEERNRGDEPAKPPEKNNDQFVIKKFSTERSKGKNGENKQAAATRAGKGESELDICKQKINQIWRERNSCEKREKNKRITKMEKEQLCKRRHSKRGNNIRRGRGTHYKRNGKQGRRVTAFGGEDKTRKVNEVQVSNYFSKAAGRDGRVNH